MKVVTPPPLRLTLKRSARGTAAIADDHRHPGQSLEAIAPVLGLYYRALSGRNAALIAYGDREDPRQYPDTHSTIRLPERIARFASGRGNFMWYKIALTHRAAHYEGGTFGFEFQRPAVYFESLRPPGFAGLNRYEKESELESFFRLFAQRQLAIEIFTTLEDLRLDEWSKRRYSGLAGAFEKIQRAALQDRLPLSTLGPRDTFAEIMVRASLGAHRVPDLPALLHAPVATLFEIMAPLACETPASRTAPKRRCAPTACWCPCRTSKQTMAQGFLCHRPRRVVSTFRAKAGRASGLSPRKRISKGTRCWLR